MYENEKCLICDQDVDDCDAVSVVRGVGAIIDSSKKRGDDLHRKMEGKISLIVHVECRREYTRPSSIEKYLQNKRKGKFVLDIGFRSGFLFELNILAETSSETSAKVFSSLNCFG